MAHVLHGPLEVGSAAGDMGRAFDGEDSNATIPVTPAEAATTTVGVPATPLANRGARQYSVATGDAAQVDIQLYPAANVTVGENNAISFADTNQDKDRKSTRLNSSH